MKNRKNRVFGVPSPRALKEARGWKLCWRQRAMGLVDWYVSSPWPPPSPENRAPQIPDFGGLWASTCQIRPKLDPSGKAGNARQGSVLTAKTEKSADFDPEPCPDPKTREKKFSSFSRFQPMGSLLGHAGQKAFFSPKIGNFPKITVSGPNPIFG